MNNKEKLFTVIPLLICSFFPLLTLILYPFGYSVSLVSYEICSAISAVTCIACVYLIRKSNHNKSTRFVIAFLPLIQLINTVIYVTKSKSFITAVSMAVCFVSCAVISEKIIASDKAKIFSVISSSLMFVVILLISFVTVFFGNLSVNTVIDTIESPNGKYYAEIIDSDQGATGASTVVYIKQTDCVNLLFAKIEKSPERVYLGDWREYESMDICWKDENTLIINSNEYTVKQHKNTQKIPPIQEGFLRFGYC